MGALLSHIVMELVQHKVQRHQFTSNSYIILRPIHRYACNIKESTQSTKMNLLSSFTMPFDMQYIFYM